MRTLLLFVAISLTFSLTSPAWADTVRLQDNAPDQHVVVKGDTLWGISETFLKDPWKWPEVWKLNQVEIKNPHLIYPGDVVHLTRDGQGNPHLSLEQGPRFGATVKLSPHAYGEPIVIKENAISSLPEQLIGPLLSHGGIGEVSELEGTPRILGSSDSRVIFASNDLVYASGGNSETVDWRVVRLGQPIKNPDDPKDILAYELVNLAEAKTMVPGNPQLVRIKHAEQEVLERDRLLPAWKMELPQFIPHAPEKPIEAKVAAILGAQVNATAWMTVVLDKGGRDGLEPGHVLALYRAGRSIADPDCKRAEKIAFLAGGGRGHAEDCRPDKAETQSLPDTRIGLGFVYKVFNKVAYALVMKSSQQIGIGDHARNPEP
jgi:hypothetical protein